MSFLDGLRRRVRGAGRPLEASAPMPVAPPETFERKRVDLRKAINAVSDVVQNRPRPLRAFDQIHMKSGDMVLQSEIIADWADGKRLAFIGDGDAISVCVAYLRARDVLKLVDALDESDDVQNVYANFEVAEAVMQRLSA